MSKHWLFTSPGRRSASPTWTSFGEHFVFKFPYRGCIGGLDWEILGAISGRFSGSGRAVLCAKHEEIKTAFDSRSIAPESLHETMFREHFSGELKL